MNIFVTSSTGLTGKAVVKAWAERGVHVRAMIHSDHRKNDMFSLGASETIIASIENEEEMREAMNGMVLSSTFIQHPGMNLHRNGSEKRNA